MRQNGELWVRSRDHTDSAKAPRVPKMDQTKGRGKNRETSASCRAITAFRPMPGPTRYLFMNSGFQRLPKLLIGGCLPEAIKFTRTPSSEGRSSTALHENCHKTNFVPCQMCDKCPQDWDPARKFIQVGVFLVTRKLRGRFQHVQLHQRNDEHEYTP
jgi:hypothetical protein